MIPIKMYWCEDVPTIEDIKQAFDIVANENVVVSIRWFVKYNGLHEKFVLKELLEEYTPESYWEKVIPHIYGV